MSLNKKDIEELTKEGWISERSYCIEGELFYARFVEKELVISNHKILEYLPNNKYKVVFGKTTIILRESKVGSTKELALEKLMAFMALEESEYNLKISRLKIKMDVIKKEIEKLEQT